MSARILQADDQLGLVRIRGARLAPDGRGIVYVARKADIETDGYSEAIWIATEDQDSSGWTSRVLDDGPGSKGDPQWSPDGRWIAFGSDATGVSQIRLLDPLTGESRQVTDLADGASDPVWSPDGSRLVVASVDASLQGAIPNPYIHHVRRLPFRTPDGSFIGDRFRHLWLVDLTSGSATQLTFGMQDDQSAAWSPDGARIAFTSRRPGREIAPPWSTDIFVIDAAPIGARPDGTDRAIRVTDRVMAVGTASWSPDGSAIAFRAQSAGKWLASATGIWSTCPDGASLPHRLDQPSDRAVGANPEIDIEVIAGIGPTWTADGAGVWYSASEAGRFGLYRLDAGTGSTSQVLDGARAIGQVSVSSDGSRVAFLANDWITPGELFVCASDGSGERRVTDVNRAWLEGRVLSHPGLLRVPTNDGRFVLDAWLFRPIDFDSSRSYPLIEMMHGGPNGTFGPTFLFVAQLLASNEYNVLLVNPRGGLGYGEAFDAALAGRCGEGDEQDLWDALDVAIDAGGVDPERIGIHGHSYGGFMAAWMPGRTDRYKASVASAIMANFTTQSLTAFYGGTHDWTADGEWPDMWADPIDWWRRSPIANVPSVTAPILFLMGESDAVTPASEHEQLFTALRARGVETELVRFVGAGHGVSSNGRPSVRVERSRLIVDWFDRYLGEHTRA